MSFIVYPDVSRGPLAVAAGQISEPLPFPELAGGTSRELFLRIVMLGDGCNAPGNPFPTFQLRAGDGAPVDLPLLQWVHVFGPQEPTSNPMARAKLFDEPADVFAIQLQILRPGSNWHFRIRNHHDLERKFTWVVADNDDDAKQPWLNLPQTLHFEGDLSTEVVRTLSVSNLGTGFLTMSLGGLTDGSMFQLNQLPTEVAPNECRKLIIKFNAPAVAGTAEELYTARSDDSQATASAHHNNRILLVAKTIGPEPGPVPDPLLLGRCRACQCSEFTPPGGSLAIHPVHGRICQTPGCRHDKDQHRAPT